MSTVNIVEGEGASWRWRAFGLLLVAAVQVLVVWKFVEASSTTRWTLVWIAAPATALLIAAAYDISTRGKLTPKIIWWVLLYIVSVFAVDTFKLLHHSLTKDPFWTMFTDASWVVICIFWIRRNPFETKTLGSIKSSVSILRD
jgi:hypothetical protein